MLFNPFELVIELNIENIEVNEFYSRVQDETSFYLLNHLVQSDENHALFKITRTVFTTSIMALMEWISDHVDDRNFVMLLIDTDNNETYEYGKMKSRFGLEIGIECRKIIRYKDLQDQTSEQE